MFAIYSPTMAVAMNDIYGLNLSDHVVSITATSKHEISGFYIVLRAPSEAWLANFKKSWPKKTIYDGVM